MANTCTDDKLHFGMPGYSNNSEDEGDVIDESDAIPTTNQQQWATTELQRLVVGTGSINGYDGCDGHNADADDEEETLQANNGSTQNLEDCRHSTRDWGPSTGECEEWTVYFRPVKYANGEANATANDVSGAKTVLW